MTTPGFTMKTVVFVGSARNSAPFWGGPARLGTRVVKFVENALKTREVKHEITILDPVELQLEVLEKPQYFYAPGTAPEKLNKIAQLINDADAILVVRFILLCFRIFLVKSAWEQLGRETRRERELCGLVKGVKLL
eukprot:TRINITY_DN238_c0_g1_i1.p1 TRINITY_DN238_c0_g1~~TRINITY_DN238_c0_g1_i1.p1  ORF type:complete len:149 (-),score=36.35 TRINITY_DN238_c0_g1_i1:300-707(-)